MRLLKFNFMTMIKKLPMALPMAFILLLLLGSSCALFDRTAETIRDLSEETISQLASQQDPSILELTNQGGTFDPVRGVAYGVVVYFGGQDFEIGEMAEALGCEPFQSGVICDLGDVSEAVFMDVTSDHPSMNVTFYRSEGFMTELEVDGSNVEVDQETRQRLASIPRFKYTRLPQAN